jgi:hypothetical protein
MTDTCDCGAGTCTQACALNTRRLQTTTTKGKLT